MARYVMDTNVYVAADRDIEWAEELERFSTTHLPFIHFHAVVAQELLAGAIDQRRRNSWRKAWSFLLKSGEGSSSPASRPGRVQDAFSPNSSSGNS